MKLIFQNRKLNIFMCLIIFTLVITGLFFWFGPGLKVSTNLSETQKALSSLEIFNPSIEVSLLRKLDVVLWMEASDREVTNAKSEVS